jgi:iron complex outermembrane receptor protein
MASVQRKPLQANGKYQSVARTAFRTSLLITSLVAIYPGFLGTAFAATDGADTVKVGPEGKVDLKTVQKKYEKLKVGQKNITSAMSVISREDIEKTSNSQSIYSLLKSTPSVNEYQQNIGPGTPVLTIRGVRMSQLAQTLDGVPMTSLLSGGQGGFLNYNVGSIVSTGQIEGIHVYPGVAPPDRGGFATVGGTVNYQTKAPTDKPYTDVFTKVGSFNTTNYGAEFNSGDIPGTDGAKVLMRISKTKTDGYIDNTPATYQDFLLSGVKPYDQGLSKLTGTVIYNQGKGYLISAPTPIDLINQYGMNYNFPLSTANTYQDNKYLTAIIGDETYVNDSLVVGGKAYYMRKTGDFATYTNPAYINSTYPYQVNFNSPYFGFGPLGGSSGNNTGMSYDPVATFGSYQAGEAAQRNHDITTGYGIAPKINVFLPHNNITVGGLIGKERETSSAYIYGSLNMPEIDGYNSLYSQGNGATATRTVYSAYAQDNIGLMDDRLHVEPGITYTVAHTSNYVPLNVYGDPANPYTLTANDKTTLPYLGVSYDLTKQVVAYANYGKGARFAPVQDYILGTSGSTTVAPGPEIVNAYQAGVRYVSDRLYLNGDIFQQDMNGLFSFYINYATGYAAYANIGQQRMRGAEVSAKYLVDNNWNVAGGLSYTQAKYLNSYSALVTPFEGQYGYVFAGEPLASVPKWLATASVGYRRGGFTGQLIAQYTGRQPTTYNISPDNPNPLLQDATTPDTAHPLGSYTVLNLHTSYKLPIHNPYLKSVTFSLNVDNLLDRKYYLHYYNSYKEYDFGAVGNPYSSAYPGEPRFFELGVVARFL